ncbi:TAXI family TRAP transporter solute-binding subunit [Aquicoccus sp. SCR17]|nr:TAXI family TRAP transporter solute-binding subunit [Carideicomes alvinocaridis]
MTLGMKSLTAGAAMLIASAVPSVAQNLSLGSTNATSSHYQIAVAMAQAIEAGIPGSTATVVETGASVDNVRRLVRGEIDLGLVAGDVFVQAKQGLGQFEGNAVEDLVALYPYSDSVLNVSVRADSGITSLEGLDGKNFSPGIRGSGAELLMTQSLELFGIKPEYVYGTVTDAVEGTRNQQLVGYSKYGAADRLDATLRELMTSVDMRLIGFDEEQQKMVRDNIPGVGFATLPADFISGNPEVVTPSVPIVYATRLSLMDDETAKKVAQAIGEHRQILVDVWPQLKDYDFGGSMLASDKAGITVHPGAKAYWESAQ